MNYNDTLNPGGASRPNYGWNFTNAEKEDYATVHAGTVLTIQRYQATKYQTHEPEFWDAAKTQPKWNIRLGLCDPEGNFKSFVTPFVGAKRQRQVLADKNPNKQIPLHMQLFDLAGGKHFYDLIGKTIQIATIEPPQGMRYGAGNPRPWQVTLVPDTVYQLNGDIPEEFTIPDLTIAMEEGVYRGLTMEQVEALRNQPQQQPTPQPQYHQFAQPMPQQQPQQFMAPTGMDPQVAMMMQQMGARNVQPVPPAATPQQMQQMQVEPSVYDDSLPF